MEERSNSLDAIFSAVACGASHCVTGGICGGIKEAAYTILDVHRFDR